MLINIDEVKVNDRIRKDFGDIEELANDIKKNGLINPPTVTPEYELIAGERRLRACKHLGFQQIEVRIVSVRDEEHQLNMEISENENRKEFTYSERMDWSKRLGRIESIKARERQGKRTDLTSDKTLSDVRADDVVAEKSGFGSREQYRKAKFIDEHADEETIKKLDEEKISIHRAWTETKEKLEQAEKRAKQAESQAETERKERERLENELENQEPEVKEVFKEIDNTDYETIKKLEDEIEQLKRKSELESQDAETYRQLKKDIDNLRNRKNDIVKQIDNASSIGKFIARIDRSFEEDLAPIKYSRAIEELERSESVQESLNEIVSKVENWCREIRGIMKNNNITEVIDYEEQ